MLYALQVIIFLLPDLQFPFYISNLIAVRVRALYNVKFPFSRIKMAALRILLFKVSLASEK